MTPPTTTLLRNQLEKHNSPSKQDLTNSIRMISSLPLLNESDIDIQQTKLALDILRKLSVSKVPFLTKKLISSKYGNINGCESPSLSESNSNSNINALNHNQTNYYQHLLQGGDDDNDKGRRIRTNSNDIVVDQFNPTPSAVLPERNRDASLENDQQNHGMLRTREDEATYCSQYYPNHHQHQLAQRNSTPVPSAHSRTSSPSPAGVLGSKLLFRSLSSPIGANSTPDSILAYLTAEENNSSSSSSSSTSASNSDDDSNHKNYNKKKAHHFYDSTSSDSSSLCYSFSNEDQHERDHQDERCCTRYQSKDQDQDLRSLTPEAEDFDSRSVGLNTANGRDEYEKTIMRNMDRKDNKNCSSMDKRDRLADLVTSVQGDLLIGHDERRTKEFESPPSSPTSPSSFYSTPCGGGGGNNTTDDDFASQSPTTPLAPSGHFFSYDLHDVGETEIKSLRDQLQSEKFNQVSEDQQQLCVKPLQLSAPVDESVAPIQLDDGPRIAIPNEHMKSLEDYHALFCPQQITHDHDLQKPMFRNNVITVGHIQSIFNCFKISQMPTFFGEKLLAVLEQTQIRDDFQWALHQMGGFHALLILYGRIVEISPNDYLQSRALNLVLNQLKNHGKLTDPPLCHQYHLLRYLLNSENSTFGHDTYEVLISHCLNPSSQRIQDYSLLLICVMESYRILLRTKHVLMDENAESGQKIGIVNGKRSATLMEHLFLTLNSLCSERNSQRDINIGILKENGFADSLLTLCKGVIYCVTEEAVPGSHCNLTKEDGLKIASLVKSLLNELMAPSDANVAKTVIQFGLLPHLPHQLPPLPVSETSFFVYPNPKNPTDTESDFDLSSLSSTSVNQEFCNLDLSFADEAKEYFNYEEGGSSDEDSNETCNDVRGLLKPPVLEPNSKLEQRRLSAILHPEAHEFMDIFQETLIEGFMTILLNSMGILPDNTFNAVLNPYLSYHILIAYCSHPNVQIKSSALKLISVYLSRVKESVISEFLKNRAFFLTSLYIQSSTKISGLVSSICHGFGPVSYSMMVGLIHSPTVVSTLIEWTKADASSVVPALLSVGLLPSIIHQYKSPSSTTITGACTHKFPTQLSHLLTLVTRYVVLNPKNEPWSVLFCPGIESSSKSSLLCSKLVRDAIEILRNYSGSCALPSQALKKAEISSRLLWLFETSVNGRYGPYFEKWLFKNFLHHIIFFESSPNQCHKSKTPVETSPNEIWKFFVRKNLKRLQYLMALFLCNIFASNRTDNNNIYYNFQQFVLRQLLLSATISSALPGASNKNSSWLIRVLKSDEAICHCFQTFMKIYFIENLHHHSKPPTRLSVSRQNGSLPVPSSNPDGDSNGNGVGPHSCDRSINIKFQTLLKSIGLLPCPAASKNYLSETSRLSSVIFNLLDGKPPNASQNNPAVAGLGDGQGQYTVPYHELRQCLVLIEKLRLQQQGKIIKPSIIKSTFKRNSISTSRENFSFNFKGHSRQSSTDSSISNASLSSTSSTSSSVPFHISNSKPYFDSVFDIVNRCALDVVDVVTKLRARQEIEIARRLSIREVDIVARQKWWNIRQSLSHPKAPWHFPDTYPSFWALDQSEGPGRIRIRLRKELLRVRQQFVKSEYRKREITVQPLQYLFYNSSEEFMGYAGVQRDIKFIRSCMRIIPGEELNGEIILTEAALHFIPEVCNRSCWDRIDIQKSTIFQILRRRYTLEDRALELFAASRCFLFVFKTQADRESFIQIVSHCPLRNNIVSSGNLTLTSSIAQQINPNTTLGSTSASSTNSELLNATLTTMTTQWVKGNLSNFDYLMHLNTAAGRTNCDLMQYPVFPFILSKYNSYILDLTSGSSFRDLRKPMAIQDPAKEDHFNSTYNYLKREGDTAPFHYGSHYSNSGIVLHFLVRLPPYTQHFLKYQDGNFDIPDRSFHSLETAWRLASRDSNTDFKEMIPEFFYLPEFLMNLQHFDMGVRQNGCRVEDVTLPDWARGNARLFTLIQRQALESSYARKHLGDWIDLIFGFKQTGPYAVQAMNVFHPSTYEGFEVDGDGTDELIRKARRAMVSTYGQTPKRLFGFPHPKPLQTEIIEQHERPIPKVLDNVIGLKWGKLVGSPATPDYEVISTREFHETISLFETVTRIVFWPVRTLILGDSVVGVWDASGIRVKSSILYLCVDDEITTCCGVDTTVWIGHESGKITVLKLSPNLTKVIESIDLVGHYKHIKCIDLNNEFSTAFSCSGENYSIAWDMNTLTFCNVIENSGPIDFVYSSRSTGDLVLLNRRSNTVAFTTINGFHVGKIEHIEKIESVCISSLDPGRNVNLIAVGCDYGIIRFYSSWDLKFLSQTKVDVLSTLAIKSIRYSKDGQRLYCLSQTDTSCLTVALQLSPHRKVLREFTR